MQLVCFTFLIVITTISISTVIFVILTIVIYSFLKATAAAALAPLGLDSTPCFAKRGEEEATDKQEHDAAASDAAASEAASGSAGPIVAWLSRCLALPPVPGQLPPLDGLDTNLLRILALPEALHGKQLPPPPPDSQQLSPT
jgi:hypothetical protein